MHFVVQRMTKRPDVALDTALHLINMDLSGLSVIATQNQKEWEHYASLSHKEEPSSIVTRPRIQLVLLFLSLAPCR